MHTKAHSYCIIQCVYNSITWDIVPIHYYIINIIYIYVYTSKYSRIYYHNGDRFFLFIINILSLYFIHNIIIICRRVWVCRRSGFSGAECVIVCDCEIR